MPRIVLALLVLLLVASPASAQVDLPQDSTAAPILTRLIASPVTSDEHSSISGSWGDYDGDGDLDLFVLNVDDAPNQLFRNEGDGTFASVEVPPLTHNYGWNMSASWGDYDNDGDLDLLLNRLMEPVHLFRNDGAGHFTTATDAGPLVQDVIRSRSATWADYDSDGFLDVFVVTSARESGTNALYHNEGDGYFRRILDSPVVQNSGDNNAASFGDYDNDGHLDLFVPNWGNAPNHLYHNEGGGTFSRILERSVVADDQRSIDGTWADYDNDGDLDLYVANYDANGVPQNNSLYRNEGDGAFTTVTDSPIVRDSTNSRVGLWGDYDNDGDLDLVVLNSLDQDNLLYWNDGDDTFTQDTLAFAGHGGSSFTGSTADFDDDGDLDLFVANGYHPDTPQAPLSNVLYENTSTGGHWLNVRLAGTRSNASALGAVVRARAVIDDQSVWQMRQIADQQLGSQSSYRVHFGLSDATVVDTLRIEWPSGIVQTLTNVQADQFITVTEELPLTDAPQLFAVEDVPHDQGGRVTLRWHASALDTSNALSHYSVWRATPRNDDTTDTAAHYRPSPFTAASGATYDWEHLADQPAHRFASYSYTARTLYDQTPSRDGTHYFLVSAHTTDSTFFDSDPEAGVSVDNLAPDVPAELHAHVEDGAVTLTWASSTASDVARYRVFREVTHEPGDEAQPHAVLSDTTFVDTAPIREAVSHYVVEAVDVNENASARTEAITVDVRTSAETESLVPRSLTLQPPYPTPVRRQATLRYGLPQTAQVRLAVYDVLGREVTVLVDRTEAAGWHRIPLQGRLLGSGVYVVRLETQGHVRTRRVVVVR